MKSLKIVGDTQVAHMLDDMGERALDQRASMQHAGRVTQRQISGIPVDTGRLQQGVKGGSESTLDVSADGYEIGTTVPYARFVFGGTENMRARPPRVPGSAGEDAAKLIENDIVR